MGLPGAYLKGLAGCAAFTDTTIGPDLTGENATEKQAVPGSWAKSFAAAHEVGLRFESPLPDGVNGYKYDGEDGPVVVLDSAATPERRNFALAHEVAHILLGHSGEVGENEEREANRLASELLLPAMEFAPAANLGLRELKEIFPHASFEAIARRPADAFPGSAPIVA